MTPSPHRTILTVITGSQAHGLATPESDVDRRGVFVVPTTALLAIGETPERTQRPSDGDDDARWEVGHFLTLATKSNPSILEVLRAPVEEADSWGLQLRDLFPAVWSSRGVYEAFTGYGLSQRKRFLESQDERSPKYAVAYLRTLYMAHSLLVTDNYYITMQDTSIYPTLVRWKRGEYTVGEVIETCLNWAQAVEVAYACNPHKQTDLAAVNDYLLRLRRALWEG